MWIRNLVLAASVISLLFALYLMVGFYFVVVDTITQFALCAEQAANGDLNSKINSSTHDEMDIIAQKVQCFITCFTQLLEKVKSSTHSLSDATYSLSHVSSQTSQDVESSKTALMLLTQP